MNSYFLIYIIYLIIFNQTFNKKSDLLKLYNNYIIIIIFIKNLLI